MFSVPLEGPMDLGEVIILPIILIFFGLLVFMLGEFNTGESGKPKAWKWIGVAILLFAALAGFRYFYAMVAGSVEAVTYRDIIRGHGRKMALAHWMVFLAPAFLILLSFFLSWRHGKKARDYDDL